MLKIWLDVWLVRMVDCYLVDLLHIYFWIDQLIDGLIVQVVLEIVIPYVQIHIHVHLVVCKYYSYHLFLLLMLASFSLTHPALFAMEINVQKDLRTGESRVLSTCTVPAHEIQQRGIKVYDDGRKSVYAVHTALDQPEACGVDELSPKEVEELLKQATEKRKKPQEQNEPLCLKNYQNSHCSEIYNMGMSEWPELEYSHSSVHDPYQEIHEPAHRIHYYNDQHEYYRNSNGNSYEIYGGETRSDPKQIYDPQERHRRTQSQHVDSVVNHVPPLSYGEDPKLSILNTLPSDEPVTMIFMGYQNAKEDAQSYEGSIQAELIIIGDGEEQALTSAAPLRKKHVHSYQNRNTNNTSTHLTSETSSPGRQISKKPRLKYCCMLM